MSGSASRPDPRPRSERPWVSFTSVSLFAGALLIALAAPQAPARAQATAAMLGAGKAIAKGALEKIGGDAMGWVLGELGLEPDPDKKILKQLSDIKSELDKIDTQIVAIDKTVIATYEAMIKAEAQGILTSLNNAVSAIETPWTTYRALLKATGSTGKQIDELADSIVSSVPTALNEIDNNLTSNGQGSTGLIEIYARVISSTYTSPVVGDTDYYSQLHQTIAYYNQWRLNAVLLLVEAYHHKALKNSPGATTETVCVKPVDAASLDCNLAAHYANRFFGASQANANAGIIAQLQIAGGTVTGTDTIPLTVPTTVNGKPAVSAWLWNRSPYSVAVPYPGQGNQIVYGDGQVQVSWAVFPPAWSPEVQKASPVATVEGFVTWRPAAYTEIGQLISALSGSGGTVSAALMPDFPNIAAETLVAAAVDGSDGTAFVFVPGSGDPAPWDCAMNFVNTGNSVTTPFDCGVFHMYGGSGIRTTGAFGPYLQACRNWEHELGLCTWGRIGWVLSSNLSPLPNGKPWPVTDSTGCASGQSGVNPAGWLKPCGNGWVQSRYKDDLPSLDVRIALEEASERVRLRSP